MDLQRACQANVWAIPIVSMAKWQYEHSKVLGAENGQLYILKAMMIVLEG